MSEGVAVRDALARVLGVACERLGEGVVGVARAAAEQVVLCVLFREHGVRGRDVGRL